MHFLTCQRSLSIALLSVLFFSLPVYSESTQDDVHQKALRVLGFEQSANPTPDEIKSNFFQQLNLALQDSPNKTNSVIDGILDAYRVVSKEFNVSKKELAGLGSDLEDVSDAQFPRNVPSLSTDYYAGIGKRYRARRINASNESYLESALTALDEARSGLAPDTPEALKVITEAVFVAGHWVEICQDFESIQYAMEMMKSGKKRYLPRYLSRGLEVLPKRGWSKLSDRRELAQLYKASTLIDYAVGAPKFFTPTPRQNSLTWFVGMQTGSSSFDSTSQFLEHLRQSDSETWKALASFMIDSMDGRLVDQFMREQFRAGEKPGVPNMDLVNDITALRKSVAKDPVLNDKLSVLIKNRMLVVNMARHGYGEMIGGKVNRGPGPLQAAMKNGRIPTATALASVFQHDPDLHVLTRILPLSERIKAKLSFCKFFLKKS